MAYTIPTSADTPEQAILAVASAVKGEQVTGGDGSVNTALDILADALAGQDVEVPMTQQGAILALAQYVGGGGGVDVGAPTVAIMGNAAPEPGGYISNYAAIAGIAIGETTIVPIDPYNAMASVASGATATTKPDDELNPTTCDAYVVTVDDEEFTAVEEWDGTLTPGTWTGSSGNLNVWSFTVPALEYDPETFTGQILYLYMH
jgi:hypothetical protein